MNFDQAAKRSMRNDLMLKNAEIHAQRLRKLKQQMPGHHTNLTQTDHNRFDLATNTTYIKCQAKNSANSFMKTEKRQIILTANHPKYFHSTSLNNISYENKILFKKIERIVKGKSKINQPSLNKEKTQISYMDSFEQENTELLNVTSDLAENMIKNKATRNHLKQMQIRDANQSNFILIEEMLQRLTSLKPTISTRQILSQTRKNQTISKRISKFNTVQFCQPEKGYSQQQFTQSQLSGGKKRVPLDKRTGFIGDDFCLQNMHPKQKRFQTGYSIKIDVPLQNSFNAHRRTKTEPNEILSQTKLPYLSPSNINILNPKQQFKKQQHNRSQSTNIKPFQSIKNLTQYKNQRQLGLKVKRSSSLNQTSERNRNLSSKRMNKQVDECDESLRSSLNQKKKANFIILAEIQKIIEKVKVKFRFVRSDLFYEIQVKQNKPQNKQQKTSSDKKLQQTVTSQYSTCKMHNPVEKANSKRPSDGRYFESQKIRLKQDSIILKELIGSQLFSSFDYDYYRIVEDCLQLNWIEKDSFSIEMKEYYKNYRSDRHGYNFENASIRQNNQDEEDDSIDGNMEQTIGLSNKLLS